ncbi:MFS transporter [Sphingobium sp. 15-1]|uniref:MFS transporter n=1 Tax=Sphingobium sp. 15-1 TaxID=2729616 RepID=UPI00159C79BE|nr:MFS transporter [Sphingobium sp. 15-1]
MEAMVAAQPVSHGTVDIGNKGKLNRGGVAWAFFEGGRTPFLILITIYIYMPYVSRTLVGDPVKGQEVISHWQQIIGWVVMATAPFLGASIDRLGARKRLLGIVISLMFGSTAALWWGKPDGSGLSVSTVMLFASLAQVLFNYTEILHNSLLVRAAGLQGAHRASSLALSMGNLFAVLALGFTAWAFALPGTVEWGWVPSVPLFGLDTAMHEHERVVALMSAGLLLCGSIPFFLLAPDAPSTGVRPMQALKEGALELFRMVKTISHFKNAAIFMGARMFFVDGMNGVLIYGGLFAVGVMKWSAMEMLLFGILLSTVAVLGGFVARWMDAAFGPKTSLRISIFVAMLGLGSMIGMRPDRIFFFWSYDPSTHSPLWDVPFFNTWPDLFYLLVNFSNAMFITGQYASSRTLLTRLTPPEQTGTFFGIYALSGVATAWLAPTLVNMGTRISGTQQGGFVMLLLLLAIGFAMLFLVRGGGRAIENA